jgi:hypothetical protein
MNKETIKPGETKGIITQGFWNEIPLGVKIPANRSPKMRMSSNVPEDDKFLLAQTPLGEWNLTAKGNPGDVTKVECVVNMAPEGRPPMSAVLGACEVQIVGDINRVELSLGEPFSA